MKKQGITIEDVARAAGVSRQTVSRVINRQSSVSAAAREAVDKAIVDLGYVPNMAARRMGGARSYLIMAINDRARTIENWSAGRGNDWVDQMLYGGMLACEERGFHMMFELVETETEEAVRQLKRIVTSLHPDGVILTQPHSENLSLVRMLEERGRPFVRIGMPHEHIDAPCVHMDEAAAGRAVIDHLVALGHRDIGIVAGDPRYRTSVARNEGYAAAASEAGIAPRIEEGGFAFDRAEQIARQWFASDDFPTAIIADNDEMAFGVMHAARRHSVEIPAQLSLLCFEDTPGVRFAMPPLTAVRQPTAALIAKASELLMDAAEGEKIAGVHIEPFTLVERETTGPAPR
ncbi:LacI family DNA-binding transcriptional regulator [Sphingomicrobium sp. XHP0235]|uniref:LacI family DNA-binding transcriptional regulator n=1 Tax=Sphingomicrobium aquimarinum TaxID=3133971 RepID=UPI0031FF30AE